MPYFLKGLLIGFSIAAPVGPIGLLCIRRSALNGRAHGFISGLGAATADALYGAVAAFGVTAITNALLEHRKWLQLGGGLFLVYLGIATIRARPATGADRAATGDSLPAVYVSTLVLTLTNPMTIFSFIGIFAGLGLGASASDRWSAGQLVTGVFVGSAVWWFVLSVTASWLGGRLQQGGLRALNVLSGLIILSFGAWQLALILFAGI